ncbi:PAS domain S-box protein [Halosimplex litoreum]|uniref:PAS domain S-box protein n=1 Tax=Halosimplex litoreum TaxID=1198301 RepID=A0A7U3WAD2_9EURY|nr:bacterio-opsin activator domain-containing protein [Halosimplex litoreum]QPV64577.1 PAS domain S-box protein [Halosimplex litoreum]
MTRTEGGDARSGGECAYDPSVTGDESFFRTLVESASDAIVTVDETGGIVFANPAIEETFGYDPETLIGRSVTALVPEDQRPRIRAAFDALQSTAAPPSDWEGVETVGRHRDGRLVPIELSLGAHRHDGAWLLTAMVRDVSDRHAERVERHRERDLTEQLLRTVPTGLVVLSDEGVIERMNDRAGEILGADPADVIGDSRETDAWRLLDADGEPVPPDERVFQMARDSGRPVTEVEQRVERTDGERVWVRVSAAPLSDGDDSGRVVVVVEDISNQKARERRLREQNEQLERLDRINAVIRGIDQALVRATTRREIDEAVCEALAAADPYHSAWIGDVNASSDEVTPRAHGGDVADYLEEITVTRSAEPNGTGPAGRAIRSRSVQVTHDVDTDPAFEGVRAAAAAHDIRSAASVPLVYDGTIYGVVTVYADEPGAFDGTEQDVLAELGATIGHAINAVTTRQALVAEHVTELRLAVDDDDHFFAALSAALDCEVAFEGATVQADETFRYYLRVAGANPDDVLAFADEFAGVESARIVSVGPEGESLLEATLDAGSAFGVIADHGGAVRSASAAEGECEVVAELPVSADVRAVVDALDDAFADIEVRAQRDRPRSETDSVASPPSFDADLTDRQRTAVETAYYAGFFEWPRESTGEEVAESLGVSAPTFHKHLRVAERKLLAARFDDDSTTQRH